MTSAGTPPPTPTTMERLVGDAPGDEETVDDNGSALKVGLVETLLARAPRCCGTQVPPGVDAPAVAQAWARAGDDVESEPESDDGKGFDQERDRKWAVRRKTNSAKVRFASAARAAEGPGCGRRREENGRAARRADVKQARALKASAEDQLREAERHGARPGARARARSRRRPGCST